MDRRHFLKAGAAAAIGASIPRSTDSAHEAHQPTEYGMPTHTIAFEGLVLEPEHGLLQGNGDLSVSLYQTSDRLIWRFGKNDVWDRRLDLSDSPRPAHIDEIARGIRDEGWVAHEFHDGKGSATRGTGNVERMKEITDGYPGYARYPYPCPKPVGELALHMPVDLRAMKIHQSLSVETGIAVIRCTWANEVTLTCRCYVPPEPNLLVVKWDISGWTPRWGAATPIWFSLRRWKDPTLEEFEADLSSRALYSHFAPMTKWGKATPLPVPEIVDIGGQKAIQQTFHPTMGDENGFAYAMIPFSEALIPSELASYRARGAALRLKPVSEELQAGWVCVAVPTSTDDGGVQGEADRIVSSNDGVGKRAVKAWEKATESSWSTFWKRSSVRSSAKFS